MLGFCYTLAFWVEMRLAQVMFMGSFQPKLISVVLVVFGCLDVFEGFAAFRTEVDRLIVFSS